MFMPLTRTYPSGFTQTLQSPTSVLDITPDAEVVELFNQATNMTVGTTSWPYVRRVIACARRLFDDDLREWLKLQDANPKLSENARGFLNDTVTFINTGVRPVSIGARMRILVRERAFTSVDPGSTAVQTVVDLSAKPITQWLKQDGGIVDMVFTLNVLFGKALSPQ